MFSKKCSEHRRLKSRPSGKRFKTCEILKGGASNQELQFLGDAALPGELLFMMRISIVKEGMKIKPNDLCSYTAHKLEIMYYN